MAVTFPYVRAAVWSDGSTTDTAAKRNTMEDGIFNAHQQPAVRVTHNANQSITTSTNTALAFNTERYDQAGGSASTQHDTVTNNSRLTCRYAGIYKITAQVEFAGGGTTGIRRLFIRLGGSTNLVQIEHDPTTSNGGVCELIVTTDYALAVNDYVEAVVVQNQGSSINVNSAANYSPEFMMIRVA